MIIGEIIRIQQPETFLVIVNKYKYKPKRIINLRSKEASCSIIKKLISERKAVRQ